MCWRREHIKNRDVFLRENDDNFVLQQFVSVQGNTGQIYLDPETWFIKKEL